MTGNSAQTGQNICRREECTILEEPLPLLQRTTQDRRQKKYVENIKWKQQSRTKCDVYTAKEI